MGKTTTPATIGDLLFVDETLAYLLEHGLVRHFMGDLLADFTTAYAGMLERPVPADASPELLHALRQNKTDLFQAFITGCLSSQDPESRFGRQCLKHLAKPQKEESKLIL